MALTKITPQMFDTSATAHDLNVDNGTFVVDGSASRVGIGTATPSTLLDVNGTATATTFVGALTGNVTGNVSGTAATVTGAAQTNITSVGTLSSLTVSGALNGTLSTAAQTNITSVGTLTGLTMSGALTLNTGGSGVPTINLSHTNAGADNFRIMAGITGVSNGGFSIYDVDATASRIVINSSGHIGIGTTSLTEKLEVYGSINATYQSNNFATGVQRGFLDMVDASKHVRFGSLTGTATASGTQGTVEIVVNNSAKVVVTPGGDIGIGNPSPLDTLNEGITIGPRTILSDVVDYQTLLANNAYYKTGNVWKSVVATGGGYSAIRMYNGLFRVHTGTVSAADETLSNMDGSDIRLTINSAGLATFSGAVTMPSGILTVGDIKAVGTGGLALQTDEGTKRLFINDDGKVGISAGGVIYASRFSVGLPANHTPGSVFTTSPSSFFSEAALGGTTGNTQKIAIFGGSDASNVSGLAIYRYRRATGTNWTTDGFSLRQEVDSSASIYDYINFAGGNVGIGTTTPGFKLTVVGESSIGDFTADGFANLGRNADGNQDVTTLGGYGVDAGSGTRYGRYGVLRFRSSANYTSGSRGYMLTNGYGANKFAIFQSSSATTMPSLGAYGSVTGGTAPFIIDNSGDITMGYQPYAHGVITGNISGPSADYGIALTAHASRSISIGTNTTHGPGITITKAGFYIMSMSFLQDPVGTYIYTGWCVNGSMVHHWHSNHAISSNHDAHSSIGKYLSVGDHVTIERTTANGITTIYGNTHSYWWICKIS